MLGTADVELAWPINSAAFFKALQTLGFSSDAALKMVTPKAQGPSTDTGATAEVDLAHMQHLLQLFSVVCQHQVWQTFNFGRPSSSVHCKACHPANQQFYASYEGHKLRQLVAPSEFQQTG